MPPSQTEMKEISILIVWLKLQWPVLSQILINVISFFLLQIFPKVALRNYQQTDFAVNVDHQVMQKSTTYVQSYYPYLYQFADFIFMVLGVSLCLSHFIWKFLERGEIQSVVDSLNPRSTIVYQISEDLGISCIQQRAYEYLKHIVCYLGNPRNHLPQNEQTDDMRDDVDDSMT